MSEKITFSARTTAFTLTDRGDLKKLICVQGPGGHLPLQAMILPQPTDVHQDQLAECWKVKVEEMLKCVFFKVNVILGIFLRLVSVYLMK